MTDERMRRQPGQVAGAFIVGAALGAAGGAAIGGGLSIGATWGAVIGALAVGGGEAVTDATRARGTMKPLWWRIVTSTMLAAVLGWLVELVLPEWNLTIYGAVFGLVFGALGVRVRKIALGIAIGAAVGFCFEWFRPESNLPLVAAATMVVYRSASAVLFRGMEQTSIMGEQIAAADVDYVVPFAARTRYVGVDFLKDYADLTGAEFVRNPQDIGIVSRFGDLRGPTFDPDLVHPLIWEFYEHTSRFHLTIIPEWRWWMKPIYLVYRTVIARPLGQANAPFGVEEVQRGVVSWIDAIDIDHSGEVDFRAWVRSYESTGEPLYLGIYTVLGRPEGAYVSVGFPLPSANFTATLLPTHHRGDGLLLKSRTALAHPGHYLSVVDTDNDELSVIKLHSFDEEIDVYVDDGELKTDHRFYLSGILFLTLLYEIERKP
ncbi:MAG: hypothetical protein QNM02_04170 [Acidimicrobiia bacterium]|nr:hypothetical protein [Acidimicrobiia bacterium]